MAANIVIPQKPRNTSPLSTTEAKPEAIRAAPKRKRRRKSGTFYKELEGRLIDPTSGRETKKTWRIKEDQPLLDQSSKGLSPAALTLWICGNMARKRDAQLITAIKPLEALLEKEPCCGLQQNSLLKKTLRHLVKLREMNAKNDFVKGPLWRVLESKLHQSGGLSFLIHLTGLLCIEKEGAEYAIEELQLENAMKILALESCHKEFVDTVCPNKASKFLEDFRDCALWAGMGLASEEAVALNSITKLMTKVVAEIKEFPRNLGNDEAAKTFLNSRIIEAFTRKTESGDDAHRELYKKRNEAARSFVLGFKRLEALGPR